MPPLTATENPNWSANAASLAVSLNSVGAWGLPGEGREEFLAGIEAVINTGVPSVLIHQLYLLPGTDFFDNRDELGLELLESAPREIPMAHVDDIRWDRCPSG